MSYKEWFMKEHILRYQSNFLETMPNPPNIRGEQMFNDEQIDAMRKDLHQINAMSRIEIMENHIRWMAQMVHQAHHTNYEGTWDTCPRPLCIGTRKFLENPDDHSNTGLSERDENEV